MLKEYTERYRGFQIRDVCYVGGKPDDAPIEFDLIKWHTDNNGKDYCFTVGRLVYDEREPAFDFEGVGLRVFEEDLTPDVCKWITKWAEYKLWELDDEKY